MEFKIKYNPELLTFLHNCLQKPEYAMVWYFDDGQQLKIEDITLRKDDVYLYINLKSYTVLTIPYSLPKLLRWKTWWGIKVVSDKGELLSEYPINYGKGLKRGFFKRLVARFRWWAL
jgi:hypothetical protein